MRKFSIFYVLAVLLVAYHSVQSYGGNGVSIDGGGVSEQNVVYAFYNVTQLLTVCRETSICDLNDDEKVTLREVLAPVEDGAVVLRFARETVLGGDLFRVSGSTWTVNSDRLWMDAEMRAPYNLSAAVQLILEIADSTRHRLPSSVKTKIRDYFEQSVIEQSFSLSPQEQLYFLFWNDRSHLVVRREKGSQLNLTEPLRSLTRGHVVTTWKILGPVFQGWETVSENRIGHFLLKLQLRDGNGIPTETLEVSIALCFSEQAGREVELLHLEVLP